MLIKCLVMRDYGEAVRRGDGGGCPFSLLHRTVVSRKREMEGRSE